jgi:hypothetical protein
MQLLIMQFSSTTCHFIPLRFKYSPYHHVFKYPQSNCTYPELLNHIDVGLPGSTVEGEAVRSSNWYLLTSPQGVTTQKINIDMFAAVRTSNLI